MKTKCLTVASVLFVMILSGCMTKPTASDPINSANYLINTLEARTTATVEQTQKAFDRVMERREFIRTSLESSEEGKTIVYRGPEDVGVTVKLKGYAQFTNIKIRYKIVGDEYESRKILSEVIRELN